MERFAAPARAAVAASSVQAERLGDSATGTQHLVLALAGQTDGLAARVLSDFAVSPTAVRESVLALSSTETPEACWPERRVPFTVELQAVLARADRESRRREHHYVGTGHVLLALSGAELSAGHKILLTLGVDFERLTNEVIKALAEDSESTLDWSAFERRCEQFPALSADDERQLGAAVSAGRAAREALDTQEFDPEREAELREVLEAGREAAARLAESGFPLAIAIAKDYAQNGHSLVYTFGLAKKALMASVWLGWEFDWQTASFSDYVKPRMVEMIEESLAGSQ
jgi:ATP-dependent Clp protease ATP-binding subunit ClpA